MQQFLLYISLKSFFSKIYFKCVTLRETRPTGAKHEFKKLAKIGRKVVFPQKWVHVKITFCDVRRFQELLGFLVISSI